MESGKMKCPKCNYAPLEFDDVIDEEDLEEMEGFRKIAWDWIVGCPNCQTDFIVREIYVLERQTVIKEIPND
jgi:transcriptional regulator NrdR family protein